MKKFSSLLIVFVCIISVFLVGCTKADNATLLGITEKYNYIATNQNKIFDGSKFDPSYNSDNLESIINSNNKDYSVLKTDDLQETFTNRGLYGILMQGVNSTYLNSNAASVIQNNEITDKKYKKNMYLALVSLEKNTKRLDNSKTSLESVFNNDDRDAQTVSQQQLAKYNLNKYISGLNDCLKDLYTLNKNYNLALENNIINPTKLEDLLYNFNANTSVSNEYISILVNNANLLISSYALNYSINVEEDIWSAEKLIKNMALILNERVRINSTDKLNAINGYKVVRTLENSLKNSETAFLNACKKLKVSQNEDVSANTCVENYYNELLSYTNTLLQFLGNLN